jgi:hypothetical protein
VDLATYITGRLLCAFHVLSSQRSASGCSTSAVRLLRRPVGAGRNPCWLHTEDPYRDDWRQTHTGAGTHTNWMGKCKVRIRRLRLVPGALGGESGNDDEAEDEEEARRILDWEHHHRAMEVKTASSSVSRSHPQVHGVESILRGRFWVEGTDSDSESDKDEVDRLSCSLHKMSISTPPESPESVRHCLMTATSKEKASESMSGARSVSWTNGMSNGSTPSSSKPRPWKGPLPLPRILLALSPTIVAGN